jgi:hypothetical protein
MHAHLIAPGVPSDLRDLPFHDDGPLTRWLMSGAQLHRDSQTHVAGTPHSANVKAGTGFFVAIVFGVQDYAAAFRPAA